MTLFKNLSITAFLLTLGATHLDAAAPRPREDQPEEKQATKKRKIEKQEKTIDCPICGDESVTKYITLSCGHEFCDTCIIAWYTENRESIEIMKHESPDIPGGIGLIAKLTVQNYNQCSLCRTTFSESDQTKLKLLLSTQPNWKEALKRKILTNLEGQIRDLTFYQKKQLLQGNDASYQYYQDDQLAGITVKEIAQVVFTSVVFTSIEKQSPTFSQTAQALEESAFLSEAFSAQEDEMALALAASLADSVSPYYPSSSSSSSSLLCPGGYEGQASSSAPRPRSPRAEQTDILAKIVTQLNQTNPEATVKDAEAQLTESFFTAIDIDDEETLAGIAQSFGITLAEYKRIKELYSQLS